MLDAGQNAIVAADNPQYAVDTKMAAEQHGHYKFMLEILDGVVKGDDKLTKILNSATLEEMPT